MTASTSLNSSRGGTGLPGERRKATGESKAARRRSISGSTLMTVLFLAIIILVLIPLWAIFVGTFQDGNLIIRNGLNLLNVSSFWQQIVIGVVIALAVLTDTLRRRRT